MSGFKTVPFCKDLDKNLSRFRVGDVVVWNRCGGHSFEVFGVCLSGMKELECDWGMGAEKKGTRFIDIYFIYASQGSVSCPDGVVQERGHSF